MLLLVYLREIWWLTFITFNQYLYQI